MTSQSHTVRSFDQDLKSISQTLDAMAQSIKSDFARMVYALINHDQFAANALVERRGYVFGLQMELEERTLKTLALRQPVATDLRYIFFAIKIAASLNAIDNNIQGTCRRILRMKDPLDGDLLARLQELCEITGKMVDTVPDLLKVPDQEIAKSLHNQDDFVDKCYAKIYKAVRHHIRDSQGKALPQDLHVVFIAKHIERAADNITAISAMMYQQTTGQMLTKPLPA